VIERSRKGTGFDYWLGSADEVGELPFQNKVRLEVSGIGKADDSFERHGLSFDEEKLRNIIVDKQSSLSKELLHSVDEDGAEYFTIKTTGQSGMSQSGLAKFVGTTPAAISRLISKVRLSDPTVNNLPSCLKPFAGMSLTLAEYSDGQGRVIVEDGFCAAVVEYYAIWSKSKQPRGNIKAQQALTLIQHLGMRVFIHEKTSWNKPATESTFLLTFNTDDFNSTAGIVVVHPQTVIDSQ